jgi:hypothetical protein
MTSYRPLMWALVENIVFLELCSEHAVDLDAAVKLQEQNAVFLHKLGGEERAEFKGFVAELAEVERQRHGDSDRYRILLNMAESMGLDQNPRHV